MYVNIRIYIYLCIYFFHIYAMKMIYYWIKNALRSPKDVKI